MPTSSLPRSLLSLALLSLLLLICAVFIDLIFPLEVEGTLTLTRIRGEPINQITIYMPIHQNENVFKVYRMEAASPKGAWSASPGSKGADEYPDYWILDGPPLESGETLQVKFAMKYDRNISYEEYTLRVVADVETEAPVTIYRSYLVDVVAVLAEYKIPMGLSFGGLTIALAVAAFVSARKAEAPLASYKPEEAEPLCQAAPPMEGEKCKEWRYVCIRLFVVDRCGGIRDNPESKPGLLRDVKYNCKGFGDLSQKAVDSILRLIEDANRIWAECCIKLVPCVDEKGRPIFKAIDPREFKVELSEERKFPVEFQDRKIYLEAEITYTIDPCQLLDGRKLEGCYSFKNSNVNVKIVWKRGRRRILIDDPAYEPGKEVGIQHYRKWVNDQIKLYKAQLGDEKVRELKEKAKKEGIDPDKMLDLLKEAANSLQSLLDKGLKKVDGGLSVKIPVSLFQIFKKIVDETYGERCIDVFIVEDYADSWYRKKEAGFAEMPGRGIFLDEPVVEKCQGNVLAHEVGHNLGLPHHESKDNVMHPSPGRDLTEDQCRKVNEHLKEDAGKAKAACPKEVESYQKRKKEAAEKEKKKPAAPEKPPKPEKIKPPAPREAPRKLEEIEKIKKKMSELENEIRSKEHLIRRNYIPEMRRILRDLGVDESDIEGDDIEKWILPEGWEDYENLRRLREGYYKLKNEIEGLKKKIEALRQKLEKAESK